MQQTQEPSQQSQRMSRQERDMFAVSENLRKKIQAVASLLTNNELSAESKQALVFAMESMSQTLLIIQHSLCHHNHKKWDEETGRPSMCLVCKHVFQLRERQQG